MGSVPVSVAPLRPHAAQFRQAPNLISFSLIGRTKVERLVRLEQHVSVSNVVDSAEARQAFRKVPPGRVSRSRCYGLSRHT
jgi:hypothetical protein